LFDSNNLRILPTGELILSEAASAKNNYAKLSKQIEIPTFVNRDFLDWRVKYYLTQLKPLTHCLATHATHIQSQPISALSFA
jgi:hypothetical protein